MQWPEREWTLQRRRGWVLGGCAATWMPRAAGRPRNPGTTVDTGNTQLLRVTKGTLGHTTHQQPLPINEPWPISPSSTLLPGTAASSLWSDTNRNVTYMRCLATPHPPANPAILVCLCSLPILAHKTPNSYRAKIRMWVLLLELLLIHRKG